jgi:hypothetical protein
MKMTNDIDSLFSDMEKDVKETFQKEKPKKENSGSYHYKQERECY